MSLICPNCQSQLADDATFCGTCGAPVPQQEPAAPGKKENPIVEFVKKIPRKYLKLGGIAAAAILVLVLVISLFSGSKQPDYFLYLKDGEMFGVGLNGSKPWEITSKLAKDISNNELSNEVDSISWRITLSADGKRIFYPDKFEGYIGGSFSLYYRNVNKPKQDPVKVASDVTDYRINEDGSIVIFENYDGDLYRYNVRKDEKEKISKDVRSYRTSEDLDEILLLTNDGDLYRQSGSKEKVKLESDVTDMVDVSEDLKTVLFMKEDALYRKTGSKEKEKVDSDVEDIVRVSEDLKTVLYMKDDALYRKTGSKEKEKVDSDIEDIVSISEDLKTVVYIKDDALYLREGTKDKKKVADDVTEVRVVYEDNCIYFFKESEISSQYQALYFFDGKKSTLVIDGVTYLTYSRWSAKNPVAAATVYDEDEGEMYGYIIVGKTATKVLDESFTACRIDRDGKNVYYLAEYDYSTDSGDLYQVKVGSKAGKPTLYDRDVSANMISIMEDGKVAYFKDVLGEAGDLYIDKKRVDSDVPLYRLGGSEGKFTYYTDWSGGTGTLMQYNKGKVTKIADEVYTHFELKNGDILYLRDYDFGAYTGDLYRFHSGKSTKIDEEVIAIIPVY